MPFRLTLSEDLSDRLCIQASASGCASAEVFLANLLDVVEPAAAKAAADVRRRRRAERDQIMAEAAEKAATDGWEEWPEIEEPDPTRTDCGGIPVAEACEGAGKTIPESSGEEAGKKPTDVRAAA